MLSPVIQFNQHAYYCARILDIGGWECLLVHRQGNVFVSRESAQIRGAGAR